MHWHQLIAKLQLAMMGCPAPEMIIIHLGGSDLTGVERGKLIKMIKRDIGYIASVFPSAYLVWSDILPRTAWRAIKSHQNSLNTINEKRKRINRAGRQANRDLDKGRYIIHEIETSTTGLFLSDGVHLSDIGNIYIS